ESSSSIALAMGSVHVHRKQRSLNAGDPTAAVDVAAADLDPVEDPADVDRYGTEASRMRHLE
ncbi:hypothetical protein, partial [Klebsiella aerogenes]|uniref:hypothetical protein n=1 Tax=Klebsiella aerogenes TaxID=548 RepID=UPI0019548CDE